METQPEESGFDPSSQKSPADLLHAALKHLHSGAVDLQETAGWLVGRVSRSLQDSWQSDGRQMTLDPELIKQVGPLAAKGVFGTTAIEIYEGGYGHVAKSADGETDGKTTKETPFEKLVTIEISQGGGYTGAALYQSAATFASAATAGFRYVARGRSGPLVQGLPPWEQTGWSTS